ncbi:17796_t:CDS:2, partial [Entrophospora sp. SA101]
NVLKISNLDETTILTARKLGVLIESQKGLKILQLIRCKLPVNVLIPSVLKQRRTLKELNFRGVNFEGVHKLDILKNSRLEKLKIIDSYNLDSNLVQSLVNSNHRKLKNVEVFSCKPENINHQLEDDVQTICYLRFL